MAYSSYQKNPKSLMFDVNQHGLILQEETSWLAGMRVACAIPNAQYNIKMVDKDDSNYPYQGLGFGLL